MDRNLNSENFQNFVIDLEPSIKTFKNKFSFKLCEEILNKIINEFSNEIISLFIRKYPNFIFTVDIIDLKNKIKNIVKSYSLNHFTDFLTQEFTEKLFKILSDQNFDSKDIQNFKTYEKNKTFLHQKPFDITKNEKIVYENIFLEESSNHSFAEIQDKNIDDNIVLNDFCLSQELEVSCNESFEDIKFKNINDEGLQLFYQNSENFFETETNSTIPSSYYLIEVSVSSLYEENNSNLSSSSSCPFDQEYKNSQNKNSVSSNFEDEKKFIENLYCEETMESSILELSKNIFDKEENKENFSLNLKCNHINNDIKKNIKIFSPKKPRAESFLSFPLKLYKLINSNSESVKWNATGDIVIIDFNSLKDDQLYKKLFRSKKTNTFIRNLNSYGFKIERKNLENKNLASYYNPFFKKDDKENLYLIKRKKVQKFRK